MAALTEPSPSARGPVAQMWRATLSQIPTTFGRLVYLTSLRNPQSGRYEHDSFSLLLGQEEASGILLRSHQQIFTEWINFTLAEQKSDLDDYLRTANRLETFPDYRNLVPDMATEVERQLYVTDLEILLALAPYGSGAHS